MSGKKHPVKNIRVSVIIPCKDAGFTLLKTMNSLNTQTYKNFNKIGRAHV